MKIFVIGNFDGITDVVLEEEEAITAYHKNVEKDNGAWIQVWKDNKLQINDPIYEKYKVI